MSYIQDHSNHLTNTLDEEASSLPTLRPRTLTFPRSRRISKLLFSSRYHTDSLLARTSSSLICTGARTMFRN